jgi:DNA-binding response OmpR family regulator
MLLIVEDDTKLAASLERMFRYSGHDAVAIPSGSEALSLLHIKRPELIILDLVLPGMDGMTLLRAIRTDSSYSNVPIIVYTADFSDEKHRQAMEAGANDFIVKGTVGWDMLIARIEKALESRKPRLRFSS